MENLNPKRGTIVRIGFGTLSIFLCAMVSANFYNYGIWEFLILNTTLASIAFYFGYLAIIGRVYKPKGK